MALAVGRIPARLLEHAQIRHNQRVHTGRI
jgi:hypothetical protein